MFRSQNPFHSQLLQASLPYLCVLCALRVEIPIPLFCTAAQKRAPVNPFPATLTDHAQLDDNAITLSPVFATLMDTINHKSFACHSYKKHRGWRIPLRRSSLASRHFLLNPCRLYPSSAANLVPSRSYRP
jgi:hypothetical protein